MNKIKVCVAIVLFCVALLGTFLGYQQYFSNNTLLERRLSYAEELSKILEPSGASHGKNANILRLYRSYARTVQEKFNTFVQENFNGNRQKALDSVTYLSPNDPDVGDEVTFKLPSLHLEKLGLPKDTKYVFSLGNAFMSRSLHDRSKITITKALTIIIEDIPDDACYAFSHGVKFDKILQPNLTPLQKSIPDKELSFFRWWHTCLKKDSGGNYFVSGVLPLKVMSKEEFMHSVHAEYLQLGSN